MKPHVKMVAAHRIPVWQVRKPHSVRPRYCSRSRDGRGFGEQYGDFAESTIHIVSFASFLKFFIAPRKMPAAHPPRYAPILPYPPSPCQDLFSLPLVDPTGKRMRNSDLMRGRDEGARGTCSPRAPRIVLPRGYRVSVAHLSILPARQHNSGGVGGIDAPHSLVPFPSSSHYFPLPSPASSRKAARASERPPTLSMMPWETASVPSMTVPTSFAI